MRLAGDFKKTRGSTGELANSATSSTGPSINASSNGPSINVKQVPRFTCASFSGNVMEFPFKDSMTVCECNSPLINLSNLSPLLYSCVHQEPLQSRLMFTHLYQHAGKRYE